MRARSIDTDIASPPGLDRRSNWRCQSPAVVRFLVKLHGPYEQKSSGAIRPGAEFVSHLLADTAGCTRDEKDFVLECILRFESSFC